MDWLPLLLIHKEIPRWKRTKISAVLFLCDFFWGITGKVVYCWIFLHTDTHLLISPTWQGEGITRGGLIFSVLGFAYIGSCRSISQVLRHLSHNLTHAGVGPEQALALPWFHLRDGKPVYLARAFVCSEQTQIWVDRGVRNVCARNQSLNLFQEEMNRYRNRLSSLTEVTAFQVSKLEQMSSSLPGESCFVVSSGWGEDMKRIAMCQVIRISVALPLLTSRRGELLKGIFLFT